MSRSNESLSERERAELGVALGFAALVFLFSDSMRAQERALVAAVRALDVAADRAAARVVLARYGA